MAEVLERSAQIRGRSPVVAGLFYPEKKPDLEDRLYSFTAKNDEGGRAAAIIAPHGAWKISGSLAGSAFSAAKGRARQKGQGGISRVVILGPTHSHPGEGVFLSDSHFFETPLGNLPVDGEASEALCSCSTLFEINDIPHLLESSLEVLLPFVGFCFPGAAIVPVLMGGRSARLISALAGALGVTLHGSMDSTLIVVSANLALHYHQGKALGQAEECLCLLEEQRYGDFSAAFREGRISACGGGLIAALLESGLLPDRKGRRLGGPLVTAKAELGQTTCYGAVAFE